MRLSLSLSLCHPHCRSVRRYPCGLIVNVLPFRSQPQCFWREILKLLMHSMGMSMVREKAVANFVERLHRPSTTETSILPGWLELRKGFHTFLTASGDLFIVRDGVLRGNLVVYNPATTRNQMLQQQQQQAHQQHLQSQQLPSGATSSDVTDNSITFTAANNKFGMFSSMSLLSSLVSFEHHITYMSTTTTTVVCSSNERVSVADENLLQEVIAQDFDDLDDMQNHHHGSDTTTGSEMMAVQKTSLKSLAGQTLREREISIGPWALRWTCLSIISSDDQHVAMNLNKKDKKMKFVGDLIERDSDGHDDTSLSYIVLWPILSGDGDENAMAMERSVAIKFMFLKDVIQLIDRYTQGSFSIMNNNLFVEEVSPLSLSLQALSIDLRAMDLRLRDGLPLVIPVPEDAMSALAMALANEERSNKTPVAAPALAAANASDEQKRIHHYVNIQVDYRYIGPASYADHHMH